jgi:CheY-like chemotaxis protein
MSKSVFKAAREGDEVLREANQKLHWVLDSIADGLPVLDKDWRFTYMNEQGARIIGMRPKEVLGRVVWSQKLVELHSGRISAQSPGTNRGSVFPVELSLASQALHATDAALKLSKPEGNGLTGQDLLPWRILLVEDHDATRSVLAQLLARRKYRVVAAATIAKARTVAQSQKCDLLISDIGLPDGSGNDLMKELFENYGLRGIALTGYGMEEDLTRGKAAGFITHLIKPVRIESLEHTLTLAKNIG